MATASTKTRGDRRKVGGYRAIAETFLGTANGGTDDFIDGMPFFAEGEAAGFEAGHVQQVGDEPFHAFGFIDDVAGQFAAGGVGEGVGFGEAAGRSGNGGERCAEIVGDAGEEGIAKEFRFDTLPGFAGFVGKDGALDGERGLVGEGFEEVESFGIGEASAFGKDAEHAGNAAA